MHSLHSSFVATRTQDEGRAVYVTDANAPLEWPIRTYLQSLFIGVCARMDTQEWGAGTRSSGADSRWLARPFDQRPNGCWSTIIDASLTPYW